MSGRKAYQTTTPPASREAGTSTRVRGVVKDPGHMPVHQYFVPNHKAKSKSRASSHVLEFLSRVFASEGASWFFKTFLLRFLFDSGSKSSDDSSGTLSLSPAR